MKTEEHAWRALRDHASAQVRGGFADRVLRAAQGAPVESWAQLHAHAAAQIRPGFAQRVVRAARQIPGVPSLLDQFVFSVGTAAVCALVVLFVHAHNVEREDAANLASWQQIASVAEDADVGL